MYAVTVVTVVGNGDRAVVVGDGHVRPVAVGALRLDDETIVNGGKKVSSSYRQDAGIQTQGQQVGAEWGRRRQTLVTTTAVDNCRPWATGFRRPAGMTSHSDADATDDDGAVVVGTVAITTDSITDGAVATIGTVATVDDGAIAATDDTVIDGTVADTGTVKKQNFHTGLDPVSREDNCAQRTLSTAATAASNSVGCAEFFVLDTGSSPVWSAVADDDATDDGRATVGTVAGGGGTDATDDDRATVVGTVATFGDGDRAVVAAATTLTTATHTPRHAKTRRCRRG